MSESPPPTPVVQLGRTPGMKPIHAVVAALFGLFWVGVLAFVLTHGKSDGSSVDVYSELPPGFTAALQAQGVHYAGLSPVDAATTDQALAHVPADAAAPSGVDPLVLRTSFSATGRTDSFQDRAALMVVVPPSVTQSGSPSAGQSTGGSDGSVYVAFLDPTSYELLTSVTTSAAPASG